MIPSSRPITPLVKRVYLFMRYFPILGHMCVGCLSLVGSFQNVKLSTPSRGYQIIVRMVQSRPFNRQLCQGWGWYQTVIGQGTLTALETILMIRREWRHR